MSTFIGTNIFASIPRAVRYYKAYGTDKAEVLRMIEDHEIVISAKEPTTNSGLPVKSARLIDGCTRWQVEI